MKIWFESEQLLNTLLLYTVVSILQAHNFIHKAELYAQVSRATARIQSNKLTNHMLNLYL